MATFGLRYFAQLRSKYKNVFWRMEIAERDYSGPSEEMEFAGGSSLPMGRTMAWICPVERIFSTFGKSPNLMKNNTDFKEHLFYDIWPSSRCINSL